MFIRMGCIKITLRYFFISYHRLIGQTVVARTNGTSVMVENLFEKLPVRRKDFVKSIKKHFQKMVRVVQSYALISVGVKIIVTNTTASLTATSGAGGTPVGSRQTVFATQSGGKLTDNVSILFGAKFASSLLPIEFTVKLGKPTHLNNATSADTAEVANSMNSTEGENNMDLELSGFSAEEEQMDVSIQDIEKDSSPPTPTTSNHQPLTDSAIFAGVPSDAHNQICTVRGLVSKVGLGVGRSDNDRQFTFCNGRPVDLPRFAKTLNEVWRKYEMKQKPAFVLDISVPAGYFDVNLTPDKREVLIVQEATILAQLREVVDALYLPVRQTMPLNQGMAGGVANPSWASMFVSPSQASEECEEGADVTPVVKNLVQSALADYLVPSKDNAVLLSSPMETASTQFTDLVILESTATQGSATHTSPGQTSSPLPHKRESVVWMSPLERDRFSEQGGSGATAAQARREESGSSPVSKRARTTDPSDLSTFESQSSNGSSNNQPTSSALKEIELENNTGEEVEFLAKSNVWNFDPDTALKKYQQLRDRKRTFSTAIGTDPLPVLAAENRNMPGDDVFDINDGTMAQALTAADRLQARILHKKVRYPFNFVV